MKKFLSLVIALIMVLGMAMPAMAETAPGGYTTDSNGVMAYRIYNNRSVYGFGSYGGSDLTVFAIQGYHNNGWKITTCDEDGFATLVRIGSTEYPVVLDKLDGTGECVIEGLKVSIKLNFTNEGKTIQILYAVSNTTSEDIDYSIGSGGDIKIGTNDRAKISPIYENDNETISGFKMVESNNEDTAQFNFFGANRSGVTPVDGFWYGSFEYVENNIFTEEPDVFSNTSNEEFGALIGTDSGAAWHWDDTVEAGKTNNHSVLIGIGDNKSHLIGAESDYSESADAEFGSVKVDVTGLNNITYTVTVDGGPVDAEDFEVVTEEDGDTYIVFKKYVGIELNSKIVITAAGKDLSGANKEISTETTCLYENKVRGTEFEVPEELENNDDFNSEDKMKAKLQEKILGTNAEITDFVFVGKSYQRGNDSAGWRDISPTNSVAVEFDYPDGTNAEDYDFVIAHLKDDGSIDVYNPVEGEKLTISVGSFSPFAIGYYQPSNDPAPTPAPVVPEREKVTVVIDMTDDADEEYEENPNTGAPVFIG